MTRDVLPKSLSKNYGESEETVAANAKHNYELLKALEVTTAILTWYACTGKKIFSNRTCTYCQEKVDGFQDVDLEDADQDLALEGVSPVIVGNFDSSSLLDVNYVLDDNYDHIGVACCRRF
jgi:hypothetical protein